MTRSCSSSYNWCNKSFVSKKKDEAKDLLMAKILLAKEIRDRIRDEVGFRDDADE